MRPVGSELCEILSFSGLHTLFSRLQHMLEKSDFTLLNTEISALRSEIEKNYTNMRGEVKEGENRMIKYALGFLGSFGALGLGAYRAMQR